MLLCMFLSRFSPEIMASAHLLLHALLTLPEVNDACMQAIKG